jgi:hypothetical protein
VTRSEHRHRTSHAARSSSERHGPFGREKIDPERAGSVRSARCPLSGAATAPAHAGLAAFATASCAGASSLSTCAAPRSAAAGIAPRPRIGATACAASGCRELHGGEQQPSCPVDQLTGEMLMISISRTPICATSSAFRLMIDRTVSAATDGSWASHSIVTTASFSMSHRVAGGLR